MTVAQALGMIEETLLASRLVPESIGRIKEDNNSVVMFNKNLKDRLERSSEIHVKHIGDSVIFNTEQGSSSISIKDIACSILDILDDKTFIIATDSDFKNYKKDQLIHFGNIRFTEEINFEMYYIIPNQTGNIDLVGANIVIKIPTEKREG